MSDNENRLKFLVTAFNIIELNAQRTSDLVTTLCQKYDCGEVLLLADDYVMQTHKLGLSLEDLMNRILDDEDTRPMLAVRIDEVGEGDCGSG